MRTVEGSCRVTPATPYDLSLAVRFFASRTPVEQGASVVACDEDTDQQLRLHAVIKNNPVLIEGTSCGSLDSSSIDVHWRVLRWSREVRKKKTGVSLGEDVSSQDVERYLEHVLSLGVDLRPFYLALGKCKPLKSLKRSLQGLKPILTANVFDAALWAIVGQQVTLGFALTLKERLAQSYGRRFEFDSREMFAAPTAESIAGAKIENLRALQLSQRKSEYLLTLSRAVVDGSLDLEGLSETPYARACEELVSLRGIGAWTANYILMRGAGHLDALPLGDAGLRRAIKSAYSLDSPPSDEEIAELAEPFRPFRSLYTLYLWQGYA